MGDPLATVTIRISEDLKRKMREFKNVNWSEYLREAIVRKIREEEAKVACRIMDEIAAKTGRDWSGVEEIRKWRDVRYGQGIQSPD